MKNVFDWEIFFGIHQMVFGRHTWRLAGCRYSSLQRVLIILSSAILFWFAIHFLHLFCIITFYGSLEWDDASDHSNDILISYY